MWSKLNSIFFELREIKANQQIIIQNLRMGDAVKSATDFYSKYNLNVPFTTMEAFDDFELKLISEDKFNDDFVILKLFHFLYRFKI